MSTELEGMKAICNYVKRSEPTVLDWIRNMDFPAKKLGCIWVSDIELICEWKKSIIAGGDTSGSNGKSHNGKPAKTIIAIKKITRQ